MGKLDREELLGWIYGRFAKAHQEYKWWLDNHPDVRDDVDALSVISEYIGTMGVLAKMEGEIFGEDLITERFRKVQEEWTKIFWEADYDEEDFDNFTE